MAKMCPTGERPISDLILWWDLTVCPRWGPEHPIWIMQNLGISCSTVGSLDCSLPIPHFANDINEDGGRWSTCGGLSSHQDFSRAWSAILSVKVTLMLRRNFPKLFGSCPTKPNNVCKKLLVHTTIINRSLIQSNQHTPETYQLLSPGRNLNTSWGNK